MLHFRWKILVHLYAKYFSNVLFFFHDQNCIPVGLVIDGNNQYGICIQPNTFGQFAWHTTGELLCSEPQRKLKIYVRDINVFFLQWRW